MKPQKQISSVLLTKVYIFSCFFLLQFLDAIFKDETGHRQNMISLLIYCHATSVLLGIRACEACIVAKVFMCILIHFLLCTLYRIDAYVASGKNAIRTEESVALGTGCAAWK